MSSCRWPTTQCLRAERLPNVNIITYRYRGAKPQCSSADRSPCMNFPHKWNPQSYVQIEKCHHHLHVDERTAVGLRTKVSTQKCLSGNDEGHSKKSVQKVTAHKFYVIVNMCRMAVNLLTLCVERYFLGEQYNWLLLVNSK